MVLCASFSFMPASGMWATQRTEVSGDSIGITGRLRAFMDNIGTFNNVFPQEKVYLHFDNTGYFAGETIWFKAYVTRMDCNRSTDISRVLYVELVHSEGEVMETCKLRIENGQAEGCFKLNDNLLSGFYEVRAYTRYMLNWDYRGLFSRVFPVYKQPEKNGDYAQKLMDTLSYDKRLPNYREKDSASWTAGSPRVTFYPEGGKAVLGLPCQVAFQVTDAKGAPMDTTAYLIDGDGNVEDTLRTHRQGRGLFRYVPDGSAKFFTLSPSGRKRERFPLPEASADGCVMSLDAVSPRDSVTLDIRATNPDTLGLTLMHDGNLVFGDVVHVPAQGFRLAFGRDKLPEGVSTFTLFDHKGEILAERMFFVCPKADAGDSIRIAAASNRPTPYGKVRITMETLPHTTFSFSAIDVTTSTGADAMNPKTWMLLSSELAGYVADPGYYFEADDERHRKDADLLMRVQGWRRYDWKTMSGNAPFTVTQPLEDGLYLTGKLHRKWKRNPVAGVDLTAYLYNEKGESYTGRTVTDSTGYYSFSLPELRGEWNMVLKTSVEGKAKGYYVAIHRQFSPRQRFLSPGEMVPSGKMAANLKFEEGFAVQDSSVVPAMKTIPLPETQVERERIYENARAAWETERSGAYKASIYYNCDKACDEIADRGEEIPEFTEWLVDKNPFFRYTEGRNIGGIKYKQYPVLWVLNNNSSDSEEMPVFLDELKSIYICEDLTEYFRYSQDDRYKKDPPVTVFLYTHHKFLPNVKGVRRTYFQGYNVPSTFEMNDYSLLPPMEDFRRTLYWNPDVTTDKDGKAVIEFYNNSSCREIQVSAEGITTDGRCIFNE